MKVIIFTSTLLIQIAFINLLSKAKNLLNKNSNKIKSSSFIAIEDYETENKENEDDLFGYLNSLLFKDPSKEYNSEVQFKDNQKNSENDYYENDNNKNNNKGNNNILDKEILHLLESNSLSLNKHQSILNAFKFKSISNKSRKLHSRVNSRVEPNANTNNPSAKNTSSNATSNTTLTDTAFWFKIKSTAFLNKLSFPDMPLYNKQAVKQSFDYDGFLVNNLRNSTDFYFRVNEKGIYYATEKNNFDILEFFKLSDLQNFFLESTDPIYTCINLKETGLTYHICENTNQTTTNGNQNFAFFKDPDFLDSNRNPPKLDIYKFYCRILSFRNETNKICQLESSVIRETTTINNITVQPIILVPLETKPCNYNWNYISLGKEWECTCSEGLLQSPIDIIRKETIVSPEKPYFHFEVASVTSNQRQSSIKEEQHSNKQHLKLQLTKNTFRINAYFGKIVKQDSSVYHCNLLIIHTNSEHKIDGHRFAMEIQLICDGKSVGDIDKKVVMVFLFNKKPGSFNSFIDDLDFFKLPNTEGSEVRIHNDLFIPRIFYSSTSRPAEKAKLHPFSFFTYEGSLTYPPCSEEVTYYVVSEILEISNAMIELLNEAIRAANLVTPNIDKDDCNDYFVNQDGLSNFREIQPLNNRDVLYWNKEKFCSQAELGLGKLDNLRKKRKTNGHYEKIKDRRTDYVFVKGSKPTNLPNSFVVTKEEALGNEAKLTEKDLEELKLAF